MRLRLIAAISALCLIALTAPSSNIKPAEAANKTTLNVVGLYSETAAGSVSYRVGKEDWKVVKVGDQIPGNAEILINVDRDWIELSPSANPNAVYEITGSEQGEVIKKMADLLKEKPKTVRFPKAGAQIDPEFTNKAVVKQYLGRQRYMRNDGAGWQDIKYGDILEADVTVNIIAANNILILALPDGREAKVVGPVRFTIEKLLKGENLYKYLNVQ